MTSVKQKPKGTCYRRWEAKRHAEKGEECSQQEIEENPALEEGKEELDEEYSNEEEFEERETDEFDISDYLQDDVADYKTRANNQSKDSDDKVIPFSGGTTFREKLNEQLQLLHLEEGQETIANINSPTACL